MRISYIFFTMLVYCLCFVILEGNDSTNTVFSETSNTPNSINADYPSQFFKDIYSHVITFILAFTAIFVAVFIYLFGSINKINNRLSAIEPLHAKFSKLEKNSHTLGVDICRSHYSGLSASGKHDYALIWGFRIISKECLYKEERIDVIKNDIINVYYSLLEIEKHPYENIENKAELYKAIIDNLSVFEELSKNNSLDTDHRMKCFEIVKIILKISNAIVSNK